MKIYKIETDDIFFAGDIHGEFAYIKHSINDDNLSDCAIVICGDIGLGFEKEECYNQIFNEITKTLQEKNVHLYMFRGNHDSKEYFDGEHFTQFGYIHIIPDYSVIQTPTRNILCVGGATSIDRVYRKRNMEIFANDYKCWHKCSLEEAYKKSQKLFWEDEAIIYDENELNKIDESGIKIDTVCTHTSPSLCPPQTKIGIEGWLEIDSDLSDDLIIERKTCDNILDYLKKHNHPLTNWYYGHFHFHSVEIIDDVKYTLLDMARSKIDLI